MPRASMECPSCKAEIVLRFAHRQDALIDIYRCGSVFRWGRTGLDQALDRVLDRCPTLGIDEKAYVPLKPLPSPPEPRPVTQFPPERFGKAACYLLDVLTVRASNQWTKDEAVEAARTAGLGTVNMEHALGQLFADGFIVELPRPKGAGKIMLTSTGAAYYAAWRLVNRITARTEP